MSPSRRDDPSGIFVTESFPYSPDPPKPKYKDAAVNIITLDVASNGRDRSKMTAHIDETTMVDLDRALDAAIDRQIIDRGDSDGKLHELLIALNVSIAKNPDEQLTLHYRRADRSLAVALTIRRARHALKLVYAAWDYSSEDAMHLYLCRSRRDIVHAPWRYLQANTWPEEERFRRVAEVDLSRENGLP